ncbi:MAG: hypothetical protein A2Z88_03340 [Omnitrophica WOR_2 bacterium GWA2_47_8]|nr:MAG: hypothetical protein A2Z88_03340 [Omnitrophica WOR_2 bacterium GWA2_47_8]
MTEKILIIIPAYNESESIKKTIQEILALPFKVDIAVIDDGSSDATSRYAKETTANVLTLPFNLGIGGAVQTGFQFAFKKNYDIAVQIDADGQHDGAFLQDLVTPVKSGEVDIAIGSRFIGPFLGYRSSFVRRIGINFFAHLISFLVQDRVTDPTSGFRAFNRKAIKAFALDYPYDYPEPEAIVLAQRLNLRFKEIPVQMRKRQAGHSSIRYLRTLYYMVKVTLAILLDMLKPQKRLI